MIRFVFALLLANIIGASAASATERRCDRCTEAQYEATALQSGFGVQYVYDFYNGEARKYFIEREPNGIGGYDHYADPLPVEAEFTALILEYSAHFHRNNFTLSSFFNVVADGDVADLTAFDVSAPGAKRTLAQNWVWNDAGGWKNALPLIGASAHSLVAAVVNVVKSNDIPTHVTVTFSDGSKADFDVDIMNAEVKVIEGSVIDSAGNPIPPTAEGAVGIHFDFSREPAAARIMEQWLIVRGAKVVYRNGSGGTSTGPVIDCSNTESGVVCTRD